MATPVTETFDLAAVFSGAVADTRPGYTGWVVEPARLTELALFVRDQLGYDLLSSVTGVDYIEQNKIEVVYHAYKTSGGPGLVFKTQAERVDPIEIDSVTPVWPGAEYQEREIFDLYGVRFKNHPDLRRILMWDGFEGYPMRKDWKEAFHEEDAKPLKSRWPEGKHKLAEERNPFKDNTSLPANFDPEKWEPTNPEELLYAAARQYQSVDADGLKADHILVNMGPQHPSTHGVFRAIAVLNGETILSLKPAIGYLHRNHEKIGERNTWLQNMPYTDRLDYFNAMYNNWGYALAVEKLMGLQVPERAEYIRVIMGELSRIQNHLVLFGMLWNDLGAFFTPALYAFQERELILDVFEAVSGSRMMCNYHRFGGVVRDIDDASMKKIKDLVYDRLPRKVEEMDRLLSENEIFISRMKGVGYLSPEDSIAYSVTGPGLRAAGIPYDIRRAEPYGVYNRFDFDVPVRYNSDLLDRYLVRMSEIQQSLRILTQALKQIPEGPVLAGKPQYTHRVPAGESYGRVEAPKGELGYYVISNGKGNPYRYHIRTPSFVNITSLEKMCVGNKIADFVTILGMMDIVLGELDR